MSSSEISPENQELFELFSRLNHSEIYQLAREAGHQVLPNYSREDLILILIEERVPVPYDEHTFDEWRYAIMRFLQQHRRALETQISCPAKSFAIDACFGCVDAQVVNCLTENAPKLHLISLHRKKNNA